MMTDEDSEVIKYLEEEFIRTLNKMCGWNIQNILMNTSEISFGEAVNTTIKCVAEVIKDLEHKHG
jgi:hypothetical protein